MILAVPTRKPVDLIRATTQTLVQGVRGGGVAVAVVVGGSSITITDPDGSKVVDADPIVVVGGEATYSLADALVPVELPFSSLWVVKWVLATASGTVVSSQPARLVAATLPPPGDQANLLELHATLAVQFDPAELQVLYDRAWTRMEGWIVDSGHQTYEILEAYKLAEPVDKLGLSLAFRATSTFVTGAGRYAALADIYEKQALDDFGVLNWGVDKDQDGTADGDIDGVTPTFDGGFGPRNPH